MNKKSIYEKVRNRDGAALLTVVVIFLVLVVVVVSGTVLAQGNYMRAKKTNEASSVYYVAETGLDQYSQEIGTWLKTTSKNYSSDTSAIVNDFKSEFDADFDGVVRESYSETLMGETARVEISLTKSADEQDVYILQSRGYLGNSSRVVTRNLVFKQTTSDGEKSGYSSNAMVSLDLNDLTRDTPLSAPTWGQTLTGPIITNKPIDFQQGATLKSAFVSNNAITVSSQLNIEGVVVFSGRFTFKNNSGGVKFHTLALKPGGSIYIDTRQYNAFTSIDYLLIPVEYKNNLSSVISYNTTGSLVSENKKIYDMMVAKILFYEPKDFNPWSSSYFAYNSTKTDVVNVTGSVNPVSIFGNNPQSDNKAVNYAEYFSSKFVLDNLSDPAIVKKYMPSVKMPVFPTVSPTTYFNQTGADIQYSAGGGNQWYQPPKYTFISANHDLTFNSSIIDSTNFNRTLDLSTRGNGVYAFRNFVVESANSDSRALNIYVGSNNVSVVVEKLQIKASQINIIGTGKLTFYVTGNSMVNGESIIRQGDVVMTLINMKIMDTAGGANVEDPTRVKFYFNKAYAADNKTLLTMNIGNNQNFKFYGTVYSDNFNYQVDTSYYGALVTINGESIKKIGSSYVFDTPLTYAPKANFNTAGGVTKGLIIAKNINFSSVYETSFENIFNREIVEAILEPIVIDIPNGGPGNGNGTGGTNSKTINWGVTREEKND